MRSLSGTCQKVQISHIYKELSGTGNLQPLNSSALNNWGSVQPGVSAGLRGAVAVVKEIQSKFATNPADVVVTGGSMGGLGAQAALINFGPRGLSGDPVYSGGVSYDGSNYTESQDTVRQTLCGVPLAVIHGGADQSVPVGPDQAMARTLQGCPGFSYTEVAGAGHGTWGAGYTDGQALSQVMAAVGGPAMGTVVRLPIDGSSSSAPLKAVSPAASSGIEPTIAAPSAAAVCDSLPAVQTLLPCGPLHVVRSQTVSQDGTPVRLNCTAWWGDLPNWDRQMLTVVLAGFNCLRVSYFNRSIESDLSMIDRTVASAATVGLRVIVNNHANEGGGNCVAQQANGLWYDKGGASGGTDGCGATGTVDDAKWIADWRKVAQRYAGNDTVIGYDLWNEPTNYGKGSCWACGDPNRDIRAAYQRAGNAIQMVDPDKLIIAEGSQDYSTGAPQGDLRGVRTAPVVLKVPGKVVYSVHEYPSTVAGNKPNDGPSYIANMNAVWGYLITEDIAPVWVGEIGASMNNGTDSAWANTLTAYVNGTAPDGLRIPAGGQGPGTDWWMWSNCDSGCGNPNGALQGDKFTPKGEQADVYSKLVQRGVAPSGASTTAYGQAVSRIAATALPTTSPPTEDAPLATTPPQSAGVASPDNSRIQQVEQDIARQQQEIRALEDMVARIGPPR